MKIRKSIAVFVIFSKREWYTFCMKRFIQVVIIALAVMGLPKYIDGITVDGFFYALGTAIVLGLINLLIKPAIKLVTLPVNILTLGLFGLVVNGAILWFVAFYMPGFDIATYQAAFIGALAIAVVNWIISKL